MKRSTRGLAPALRAQLDQARALAQRNYLSEARTLCAGICSAQPRSAEVWFLLGSIHGQLREHLQAADCLERAIRLHPDMPEAHYNLALVRQQLGEGASAISHLRKAILLRPDYADAYHELANAHRAGGQTDDAVKCYQRCLAIQPEGWLANFNLANTLLLTGEYEQAERHFQLALDLPPPNPGSHSGLLHVMNYFHQDPEAVFSQHRAWWQRHCSKLPLVRPAGRSHGEHGRIRVGYVSPDFHRHSVAYFIEPLLRNHDRSDFQISCYSDTTQPDDVTDRLHTLTERWRDIGTLTDAAVAELIRQDEIDILVDLAGHTNQNRLMVFARKPAPIQVSYLGYPNTTGMPVMDYRLSDAEADPPDLHDALYTETLVRLPHGFLCYAPPPEAPPVTQRHSSRPLTFGSFNHLAKINPQVIALWAELLKSLPEARLLIKNTGLENERARERLYQRFQELGVSRDRIGLRGRIASITEHLALYNDMDIALDTFPYNGTTTTCEALWMGVPVVTLAGNMHAGRVGTSLLTRIGLQDLIASTYDEYVSCARTLARDADRLSQLRTSLRERLATSPLCDGRDFATLIEDAYRKMLRPSDGPE